MALRSINGISLCSGIGGLDLGVKLTIPGYRTVCYVEREAYAAAVLAARMEEAALDSAPIWADLRTFEGRRWRGAVDIVIASYPCQGFSLAGKRRGVSDDRHLWPEVFRIVRESEPSLVFCENVSGHLSLGFDGVVSDMEGLGYQVAAVVSTAWAVGAPHIRERLFWLASRRDERSWDGTPEEWSPSDPQRYGRDGLHEWVKLQLLASDVGGSRAAESESASTGRLYSNPDGVRELQPEGSFFGVGRRSSDGRWWPTVSPICRTNDGISNRVDRLRALGNAVVSQQAAASLGVLLKEIC